MYIIYIEYIPNSFWEDSTASLEVVVRIGWVGNTEEIVSAWKTPFIIIYTMYNPI